MKNFDLVVVGGGPAGISAAITAESEGIQTLLIERRAEGWGGQASESSAIENYFGFPQGVTGIELTQRGISQARKFGTELLMPSSVARFERRDGKILVTLDDGTIIPTRAVILALGVDYRILEVDGVSKLVGCGVKYGSPHLSNVFERKRVVVIGGANSAGQAAVHLCKQHDCEVHMVVRNETLSTNMSAYLIERINKAANVKIHYKAQVREVVGDGELKSVILSTPEGEKILDVDAMFILIGGTAKTAWIGETVAHDQKGFIYTGNDIPNSWWKLSRPPLFLESSMPGVFVAGDVRHGSIKRIALAAAEGAMAVQNIHGYLALKDGK